MAHSDSDDSHMVTGVVPAGSDVVIRRRSNAFSRAISLVPGFAYLLILYVIGFWLFRDPRVPFIELGPFKLSWIEVVLFLAAVVACVEILKVSQPGINNTTEVALMGVVALLQFGLIIASLYDQKFAMFKTTESLSMFLINGVQTLVAFHVNSRSLQRTISNTGL